MSRICNNDKFLLSFKEIICNLKYLKKMPWNPLSCTCGKYFVPQRAVAILFVHLALLNAYNLRVVLNIAITEMTAPRNESYIVDACPELKREDIEIRESQFNLTSNEEAIFLYAFYIGYILSHVPGGFLADRLGARHVMGVCMLLSAIVTIFFPLTLNKAGVIPAIILRTILGVVQGPIYPTVATFIQSWIPPSERSISGAIAYSGANLGTVIGSIFSGMMIHKSGLWSLPFYVWGILTVIWYVLYMLMVFSHPYTHPFITEREATFLENTIKKDKKKFKVPWLKIITSLPVWALLFGQFAHNLLFFVILTDLPKYLDEILKMDIQHNAIYTAIPFGLLWVWQIVYGFLADLIIRKEWLSVRQIRVISTGSSVLFPSICLVLTSYVGCHQELAITLFTLAVLFMGPFYAGMKVNVNDITVNYAGTILAIVSGIAATGAIIGPALVGALSQDESLESWQTVYWIMFGISNFFAFMNCIFTRGERQPWDFPDQAEN